MYRYSYDGAGNLVQVRNDSQTQVLKSYTYSPAGLLATGTFRDKDGNTRTLSNNWDADSNRVGMNANGTAYAFVYDTTAGIPAVLEESTLGSTAHYIREPGGALIARLNATNGTRYYHFDELGSTRLLTDSTGSVTDRYTYDASGSLLSHDRFDGSVNQPYQYVGQLGYYTHWIEPDFELLQLGVRFYDPEIGRFTQMDPIEQTNVSSYCYAEAHPTSLVDPNGKKCRPFETCPCMWRLRNCLKGDPNYDRIMAAQINSNVYCCDSHEDMDDPDGTQGTIGLVKWQVLWWRTNLLDSKGKWDMCEVLLHELIHATADPWGFWRNEEEAYRYGDVDSLDSVYARKCRCRK